MTFIVIAAKIILFLFQGALKAPQLDWLKNSVSEFSECIRNAQSTYKTGRKINAAESRSENDVPRYLLPLVLNALRLHETSSAEDISLFFTWVSDSLHLSNMEYSQFEDSKATP